MLTFRTSFFGGVGAFTILTGAQTTGFTTGFTTCFTTGFIGARFLTLAMFTSSLIVLSVEQQKGNLSYGTESTLF